MKRTVSFFLCILTVLTLLSSAILNISAEEAITENLWDFNTSYCGYYDKNGEKYYSYKYQTSADIEVKEGDVITFGPVYDSMPMYLMTLDANGNMIERVTMVSKLTNVENFSDGTHIKSYTVPAGVKALRVCCSAALFNTFVITKNSVFSVKAYDAYIEAEGNSAYSEFRQASKIWFRGKKLLFCGDSVGHGSYEHYYEGTANAGVTSKTKKAAWCGRLAALFGITEYTNPSHGGATYSTKYPSGLNIPEQVKTYAAGQDIIVIEGGTVDCGGYGSIVVPLGYLSEGYELNQFAGANTFIGGIERAFYYATTLAPDAIIVCVIPYSAPSSMGFNNGWERLYQYIPYVCEKWGIPYVNLYKNDTVNKYFDYDRSKGGLYYYDTLHCTPLGYTASTLEIAMKIYSCGKYSEQTKHMPENIPYLITKEATDEPEFTGKYIECDENLFRYATRYRGLPTDDGTPADKCAEYVTSDYIAVTPGDVIYMGPCSPYESRQLVGYNENKKSVTGDVTSTNMVAVGYFNNSYIIYAYTVPEGVSYVRCTFLATKAPMITLNEPFDISFYNKALDAANKGQEINFALTEAPVTTAEIITEVLTEAPESTVPETEAESAVTPSEETPAAGEEKEAGGCKGSSSAALIVTALAAAYVFLRRRD